MKLNPLLLSIVLSLSLAACSKDKPEETASPAETTSAPAPAPEPAAMDQGREAAGAEVSTAEAADNMSGHEIYLAKCISCHGDVGQGVGGNPKLAGLKVADVESRLKSYREGKQTGPKTAVMAATAKTLTDEQIAALARHLGE